MAVLAFFVTYEVKTVTITTLNATILSYVSQLMLIVPVLPSLKQEIHCKVQGQTGLYNTFKINGGACKIVCKTSLQQIPLARGTPSRERSGAMGARTGDGTGEGQGKAPGRGRCVTLFLGRHRQTFTHFG